MTDWKYGLFQCYADCEICTRGLCCPCILGYRNAENLGRRGILYGLLYFVVPCVPCESYNYKGYRLCAVSVTQSSSAVNGTPYTNTLFIPPAAFFLRNEARKRYGIEGSTTDDCLTAFCCVPCVDCQTALEIADRGDAN